MKSEVQLLSQPVKISVIMEAEELKSKKEKTYESVKDTLPAIQGFRKGHIPRNIAEERFSIEQLYKEIIDDLVVDVMKEHKLVSCRDFTIYGDMKDNSPLKIEFVAETEPSVELAELSDINVEIGKTETTEEDIQNAIQRALKEKETYEEIQKDAIENLDIVLIDYEGILENEKKTFTGGNAKNYRLVVDIEHKTFIDNFEEQMIGMKKGETKFLNVSFPTDYRDKTKAGKKATFKVTVNSFQKKNIPELNDEFAKSKGFRDVEEFKQSVKDYLIKNNEKANSDNLKRETIKQLTEKSKFSPIPEDMVNDELNDQWNSFLRRIGKTEEEYLKENAGGKQFFFNRTKDHALALVKTSLILKNVISKYKLVVSKEDVKNYVSNISKILNHNDEKSERLLKDLENNTNIYQVQEKATLNEKAINFLVEKSKK